MMSGVKILTLFKQHYLNRYPEGLKCDYTCFGYYDGMDVIDVEEGKSQLFQKKSKAAISDMWYQIAKKNYGINGKNSQQNIGIFRKTDEKESDFWDEKKRRIFLSVCFVQLKEWKCSKEIAGQLESQSNDNVGVLVYNTFDNADIVVFLQSNSYEAILNKIKELEVNDELAYVHSINGVLEKSLQNVDKNKGRILDNSGAPLDNHDVCELRLDIVATEKDFEKKLWSLFKYWDKKNPLKNYEGMTYSHVSGHGNYTFLWKNTDMQSVLYLFVPEGIGTHRSGLFGKTIYNIETQIHLQEEKVGDENVDVNKYITEARCKRENDQNVTGWCDKQIEKYQGYMKESWDESDEGFYSYCRSMIQTLNMLAQFEKFELSNEIFHIIYPAFELFSKQLEKVYDQGKSSKIKETLREFSEAVNTIVYHAIHTDQVFLMIPGYSGTSFSIPTKLSLFYLWYLSRISEILNDGSYRYEFFLTPVMEIRPHTSTVDFGLPAEDRLISVKVSQRSLYMPRMLLIILAHETAHYVGNRFRNRKERLNCIVHTMAHIIVEGIYPHYQAETEGEKRRIDLLLGCVTIEMKKYLEQHLKGKQDDEKYHASNLKNWLKGACLTSLADENREISNILRKETEKSASISERIKIMEVIQQKAEMADKRRIKLLGDNKFTEIIDILFKLYQEVFADAAAKEILQFKEDDYATAFDISVGCKITHMTHFDIVRKKVILTLNDDWCVGIPLEEGKYNNVIEYWMYLDAVEIYMKQYLRKCKEDLQRHFAIPDARKEKIEEVRMVMNLFSTEKNSWEEIYHTIIEKAGEYSDEVKQGYSPLDGKL